MVTVSTWQSKEYGERSQYPMTCYTKSSCTLRCPHDLAEEIPSITSGNVTWYKVSKQCWFMNVDYFWLYLQKFWYLFSLRMTRKLHFTSRMLKKKTVVSTPVAGLTCIMIKSIKWPLQSSLLWNKVWRKGLAVYLFVTIVKMHKSKTCSPVMHRATFGTFKNHFTARQLCISSRTG